MMQLTTLSEKIDDQQARVYWRVGDLKRGILDVTLDFAHPDSALLAELMALQHLLFEKCVFNRQPIGGHGFKLTVSKGAIKKLAQGRSDKVHAQKFAAFLSNRMKGVTLAVSASTDWITPDLPMPIETLGGSRDLYTQTHITIDSPSMGTIHITRHALEQYIRRLQSGEARNPLASLSRRLMHERLRPQPLDPQVSAHKLHKYGQLDEFWGHASSAFRYIVKRQHDGSGILVTVMRR